MRETKQSLIKDTEALELFQDKYPAQGVTIFGSARTNPDQKYYKLAESLASKLADLGQTVITGGGGGIMEAASKGAFNAGGTSLGFNIQLPFEQHLNEYTTDSFEFEHFFTRKQLMMDLAHSFVYFPGGTGTLDELYTVLVRIATKKLPFEPVFLVGVDFWTEFIETTFNKFLYYEVVDNDIFDMVFITDDVDEVASAISKKL
jgi:uncharacterized protein (TIGR00730 family)